jgi:hypothetical protein
MRKSNPEERSVSEGAYNSDCMLEDLLVDRLRDVMPEGETDEEGIASEGARNSDFMLEHLLVGRL